MKDQKFQNSPYISEFHVNICDISVGGGGGNGPHLLFVKSQKQKSWVCYNVLWTNLYNLLALYPKALCPINHQLGCQSIPKPILKNFCKSVWRGGEDAKASCPIWCLSLNSKVTCLCLCIKRNDFTSSLSFRKWQNSTIQYLLLLFGNLI